MSSENEKTKEKEEKTKSAEKGTPDTANTTPTIERRSRRQARSETENNDKSKEKSKTAVSILFISGIEVKLSRVYVCICNHVVGQYKCRSLGTVTLKIRRTLQLKFSRVELYYYELGNFFTKKVKITLELVIFAPKPNKYQIQLIIIFSSSVLRK